VEEHGRDVLVTCRAAHRVVAIDFRTNKELAARLLACSLNYGKEVDEVVKQTMANIKHQHSTDELLLTQFTALQQTFAAQTEQLEAGEEEGAEFAEARLSEQAKRMALSLSSFHTPPSFKPLLTAVLKWVMAPGEWVDRAAFLAPCLKHYLARSKPVEVADALVLHELLLAELGAVRDADDADEREESAWDLLVAFGTELERVAKKKGLRRKQPKGSAAAAAKRGSSQKKQKRASLSASRVSRLMDESQEGEEEEDVLGLSPIAGPKARSSTKRKMSTANSSGRISVGSLGALGEASEEEEEEMSLSMLSAR
jgi:hypothetical protein